MAPSETPTESFVQRHYFFFRRLHSLAGLVPVGVFLIMHLSVNSSINAGAGEFQKNVDRIHALGPLLVPVEIVGIFIPLLFHALLGLQIWFSGKPDIAGNPYGGNYRYVLQRVTGGIAFVFILYHVWHMHWVGAPFGGAKFDPHDAAASAAIAMNDTVFGVIPVNVFYAVGVLSAVFHLANGVWTSLITWGISISDRAQRNAGYVCAALGVALALMGLGAVRGFATFMPEDAGSGEHVVDQAASGEDLAATEPLTQMGGQHE